MQEKVLCSFDREKGEGWGVVWVNTKNNSQSTRQNNAITGHFIRYTSQIGRTPVLPSELL